MTTAQVVEPSVTNNSLSQDYPHPDDNAKHITHNPWVQTLYHDIFLLFVVDEARLLLAFSQNYQQRGDHHRRWETYKEEENLSK